MTDMERLCRAACEAVNKAHGQCGDKCEKGCQGNKEFWEGEMLTPVVRAVLRELREPTKEMIVRGQGAGYDAPMEDIYKAMIDTILQEAE